MAAKTLKLMIKRVTKTNNILFISYSPLYN
jgi:hypothetical protein